MCTGNQYFTVTAAAMAALCLAEPSQAAEDLAGEQSCAWRAAELLQEVHTLLSHRTPAITVCTKANKPLHLLASIHMHIFIVTCDGPILHLTTSFSFHLSWTHSYLETVSREEQALIFFFLSNIPLLSKLWHSLSSPTPSLYQVFCRHPAAATTKAPLFSAPCGSSHMHVLRLSSSFISFMRSLY